MQFSAVKLLFWDHLADSNDDRMEGIIVPTCPHRQHGSFGRPRVEVKWLEIANKGPEVNCRIAYTVNYIWPEAPSWLPYDFGVVKSYTEW